MNKTYNGDDVHPNIYKNGINHPEVDFKPKPCHKPVYTNPPSKKLPIKEAHADL